MKKAVLTFLAVGMIAPVFAQENTSGVVKYEKIVQIEITLRGDAARYQDMVPRERKMPKELIFNEKASYFRNVPRSNDEAMIEESSGSGGHGPGGGMRRMAFMMEPEDIIYHNIDSKKLTEQRDFMTRKFLIEAQTDTIKWRLTGKQKMILNYMCMEAELVNSPKKTIAWFTPIIPVQSGPDGFAGLPGLILSVDIDNGKTILNATSVELKPIASSDLVVPKEGKKVTRSEYDKMVADKMKEMQENSGGAIRIRF